MLDNPVTTSPSVRTPVTGSAASRGFAGWLELRFAI
jgi:hypothetical protein